MRRWLLTALVLIAALLAATLLLAVSSVRIPAQRRLADCRGASLRFAFTCPRGELYRLLLGVPPGQDRQPFAGRIRVEEDEQPAYEFAFSSGTAAASNWLDEESLTAFILTWGETDGLKRRLRAGRRYTVEVDFDKPPPPGSSLWLTGLRRNFAGGEWNDGALSPSPP